MRGEGGEHGGGFGRGKGGFGSSIAKEPSPHDQD